MKLHQILFTSLAFTGCYAGSAAKPSICDKYTTALLKENTAKNQQTLLTLVVNTAVIGNYTKPNVGIAVPGILAPGTGKFAGVNLAKYFGGMLKVTNPEAIGMMGKRPIAVNWLDGGGAAPLMMNMAANNPKTNQYALLTHLYQYFAALLGCSQFGKTVMPYSSELSMYKVHKFMHLGEKELGYFITQVGMSAASFGVSATDVATVGKALMDTFGYRCSPPTSVPAGAPKELQSICIQVS
ncbi:Hypothetical predicted protein [Lecanosticta acicola]|uniref:Uncharacterized protein n=1 Tax=Lecanosticta acicola TaxID=111012 RepID=A0AAI8YTR7_9PEZI|nr:Hypothetical predicted protein [Lecanosticta acicola]